MEKPLGLTLAAGKTAQGGLVVKSASGNAAKAGISPGDTVIYTSSFFGDELWPSDKLDFTRSAINAAPSPVTIVVVKGENTTVDVKRLPKRPAPPRFGRKLTAAQKERATHICVDCGYIYCDDTPFAELPSDYRCPQVRRRAGGRGRGMRAGGGLWGMRRGWRGRARSSDAAAAVEGCSAERRAGAALPVARAAAAAAAQARSRAQLQLRAPSC